MVGVFAAANAVSFAISISISQNVLDFKSKMVLNRTNIVKLFFDCRFRISRNIEKITGYLIYDPVVYSSSFFPFLRKTKSLLRT